MMKNFSYFPARVHLCVFVIKIEVKENKACPLKCTVHLWQHLSPWSDGTVRSLEVAWRLFLYLFRLRATNIYTILGLTHCRHNKKSKTKWLPFYKCNKLLSYFPLPLTLTGLLYFRSSQWDPSRFMGWKKSKLYQTSITFFILSLYRLPPGEMELGMISYFLAFFFNKLRATKWLPFYRCNKLLSYISVVFQITSLGSIEIYGLKKEKNISNCHLTFLLSPCRLPLGEMELRMISYFLAWDQAAP